jgi:hypothetical protein
MILAAHDLGFKDQLDAFDPLDLEEKRRKRMLLKLFFLVLKNKITKAKKKDRPAPTSHL